MRLLSRAALVIAATLVAVPAVHAQTSISASIGATLPIGTTGDAYDMGYNATLGIGIKPPVAPLGIRFEGMYNQMEAKSALGDFGARMLAGIANVTVSGAGMAVPNGYLIGGLGMYNSACTGSCGLSTETNTDFGINVGAGLNIPLTGFGTFVEARLHVIMNDGTKTKFIPITFGMKF
jgi:hypothetical protein